MQHQRVHVVINPAAGQGAPILAIINKVFQEAGLEWEVSITKQAGDAFRQAQAAVASGADVVAAHGGDGTVAEVAGALMGTAVPLAILPGGTANVMAVELGIPNDLAQACRLLCPEQSTIRKLDMGQVNEHNFLLRVGVGFEAAMVEKAEREIKDRFGVFAYLWSAVQNLAQPETAHYQLTLDGQAVETDGLTCIIANSGNLGQKGINLISSINVSDGVLDVIVIQQASLRTLFDLLGSITGLKQMQTADSSVEEQFRASLQWWQAKSVSLTSTPPQTVQYDGEILGKTAIECQILPAAIQAVVPKVAAVG
jgi:YegS/Rv2252/BmrU family lipid kinase